MNVDLILIFPRMLILKNIIILITYFFFKIIIIKLTSSAITILFEECAKPFSLSVKKYPRRLSE